MTSHTTDHDLEQVLKRIQTWKSEATNWRNDGYVMQGHKNRLRAVAIAAAEALAQINDNNLKSVQKQ